MEGYRASDAKDLHEESIHCTVHVDEAFAESKELREKERKQVVNIRTVDHQPTLSNVQSLVVFPL